MVTSMSTKGRRQLPLPLGIIFLIAGPTIVFFCIRDMRTPEAQRILSCTRESADMIACEPGRLRGPQASAKRSSGKSGRDCFVLGDLPDDRTWLCGGDVHPAAARVNALAPGQSANIDITPEKQYGISGAGLFFGSMMVLGGLTRMFGSIRKTSKS